MRTRTDPQFERWTWRARRPSVHTRVQPKRQPVSNSRGISHLADVLLLVPARRACSGTPSIVWVYRLLGTGFATGKECGLDSERDIHSQIATPSSSCWIVADTDIDAASEWQVRFGLDAICCD